MPVTVFRAVRCELLFLYVRLGTPWYFPAAPVHRAYMDIFDNTPAVAGDRLSPGTYFLHSRFRGVVNFRNVSGGIVFVTIRPEWIAGNGVAVHDPAVLEADTLRIHADRVFAGTVRMDRNAMETYDSAMPLDAMHSRAFENAIHAMPDQYGHLFPPDSMFYVVRPVKKELLTGAFDIQCMQRATAAASCLLDGRLEKGVSMLKGMGRGLTPAGDDFIAGLLHALTIHEHITGKEYAATREKIFSAAKGTNLLVNSGLFLAKTGSCTRLLKNFVLSCCRKGPHEEETKALLSRGATSGADLLAGIVFGIINRTIIW